MAKILIADSDARTCRSIAVTLCAFGHDCEIAESGRVALERLRGTALDLVLCDLHLEGLDGLDLLRAVKSESPATGVLIMTLSGTIESAVEAMQLGALNYLRKPLQSADLRAIVESALDDVVSISGVRIKEPVAEDLPAATGVVGESEAIADVLEMVAKVSQTDSSVLITGETGTGKELIGRAVHKLSRRRDRVFCAINSAAFPESLLESELFGHRRGAFTGAMTNKKGLFEFANHGTVFLDEVAEMPSSMQVKLLRFLQTGEIRPVGDENTRFVDVRLVTATNKSLEEEVESRAFREDLYYRLAVIPVHVPPLRERSEDIPLLASHFLTRFAKRAGKMLDGIDESAMDLLTSYSWPGNVRQLENSIERGVALCRGSKIRVGDLPVRLRESPREQASGVVQSLQAMERRHILDTLDRVGWNRKRAAEQLQISTTTLWRRLKEFGVETDRGRRPVSLALSPRG